MLLLALVHAALAGAPCAPLEGAPLTFAGRTFQGTGAFADRVVAYLPGPGVTRAYGDDLRALGVPDFDEGDGAASLGNRGAGPAEIVLSFSQARLVDGPGPDFFVFESGPSAEAVEVAVSADGHAWHTIGVFEGSARAVDLAGRVPKGGTFSVVRLRTASLLTAGGPWAGPDIDAVGLINACAAGSPSH